MKTKIIMKRNKSHMLFIGLALLFVLLCIHLFIAANYYFIKTRKLPEFFILQTNVLRDVLP